MNNLSNKVAWVTGGARGIGAAIVTELRERGAHVFATDVQDGHQVEECDVSKPDALERYARSIASRAGRLDILVNNAGIQKRGDFVEFEEDDFDRLFQINVRGYFFAAQSAARILIEAGNGGSIVNICSINADRGFPDTVPYCASKGAVRGMTKALAVSLGRYGIRVNSVAPGMVVTDFTAGRLSGADTEKHIVEKTPLSRLGTPSDIAPAVAFLSSDEAAFITGATLAVNGGWSLVAP